MDLVRVGLSIRALRRRRGWTQTELGRRSDCSGALVSRIERGLARQVTVERFERILGALGARLLIRVLWQGEGMDRLLDRDHAGIVEAVLGLLRLSGWITVPEATFQVGGERGSIDILAWHPDARVLLVIEVKSVVPDVQATLSGIDRKARIAPTLARDRGWAVSGVARLLVLPEDRTARRRVERFGVTFGQALPARSREIRRWLREPSGAIAGVLFLSDLPAVQARHRVTSPGARRTHGARVDS